MVQICPPRPAQKAATTHQNYNTEVFHKIHSELFDGQEVYSIPADPTLGGFIGATTVSLTNRSVTKIRIGNDEDGSSVMGRLFLEQFNLSDNFTLSFERTYATIRQSNGDFSFRIPGDLEIEKLVGFIKALNSLKQPRNKGGVVCAV